jgi:hypothetical protein
MTHNLNSKSPRRGTTVAGLGGLALASVLLLCGAGNAPIENFTPQGAMQADLNAGGHSVTNAAAVNATNVGASSLTATSATVGSLSATNLTVSGALTATNFTLPYASLTGNPVSVTGGKTLGVSNSLTLAGTDGSTLNIGAGGTLGSAAFAATNAFLAPAAIGATVQGYNASTTTLGNTVNGTNSLVQTDGNGLLVDTVLRPPSKSIYVSQGKGSDTRTGLSKYSLHTPFATLTAAVAAAASGDTIVAQDGVFTDKNIALPNGVDWLFLPGATITVTGASNGDTLFKDNGTAVTAVISGCGQTFSIASTAASTSIYGLEVTASSTLTVFGLNLLATDTSSTSSATAISSTSSGALLNVTGNLTAAGGTSSAGYGVYFSATGGGTVSVNGNVTGAGTSSGDGFYAASGATGTLTVSQKLAGSNIALSNSSATTVTCGSLSDYYNVSTVNNHLTLLGAPVIEQTVTPTTGFNQAFEWGAQDQLLYFTPSGTLATGTVTFPSDSQTRIGQRMTIATTQTITTLTVSVPSGTVYGYTAGTLNAGSISFLKIAANVWTKL